MEILELISDALQKGAEEQVGELTRNAIKEGLPPREILDAGLIGGMNLIGEQFRKHEVFLPDLLMAAKAMYAGLDELKPLLEKDGASSLPKVVIGTVHGDLHDIGKNLVGIMLRGAGFEVIDLGNDVSPQEFVTAARESGAQLIGMSALLTTTMPRMAEVIDSLKEAGIRDRVKVIVGGAPVTAEYAEKIGADVYGPNAASAVERLRAIL